LRDLHDLPSFPTRRSSDLAATHWAVAVGCVEQLGLPPLAANAIGWLVAFVVSFTGHYRLTFRHLASRWTVAARRFFLISACGFLDRKSTRLNSSHVKISYA